MKNSNNTKWRWGCGETVGEYLPYIMGMWNVTETLEDSLAICYETIHQLQHNAAVAPLDIYPRQKQMYDNTNLCTQMFMSALLKTAPNRKQSRYPSVGE